MQREDVERLATELDRQDEYAPLGHMGWEAAAALRALLAERDAAFAAGQEEMRERAAEVANVHVPISYWIRALPIKPRPE